MSVDTTIPAPAPLTKDRGGTGTDPQVALLERIARSLDDLNRHLAEPPTPRLLLRLDDLAVATGLDRRTIERERSAGRFPKPDVQIGEAPLWKPETIRAWIDAGGAR